MSKRTTSISFGIIISIVVILSIVFMKNSGDNENVKASLDINVMSLEKLKDGSVFATAEIVNKGDKTFEENKIFIVEESPQEVGEVTHGSKNEASGVSTINDKAKNINVKELSGSFKKISPKEKVRIGFSVPYVQTDKKLLIIMQSLASKDGFMEGYTTLTQPLK